MPTDRPNLRDLWIWLGGYAYASPKNCDQVLSQCAIGAAPGDIAQLLYAIKTRDKAAIAESLKPLGLVGGESPIDDALRTIQTAHVQKICGDMAGMVYHSKHATPQEFVNSLKQAMEVMERNGIKPAQPT
jgi:hypothetical protein